jgi:hypothetical protein
MSPIKSCLFFKGTKWIDNDNYQLISHYRKSTHFFLSKLSEKWRSEFYLILHQYRRYALISNVLIINEDELQAGVLYMFIMITNYSEIR